ncbi:hypothetical protein [Leptospira interrogans]|uniref:Uncharacterized protein n=1 Tax=Leptospira interrogans str. UI 12621 TaxID=1049937 RepID=A0A0F6HCS0_LEPIR|nr:hypothetical protein [Leptospira interrogans]EKO26104.1 hypothetical protein LEP1GSC104_3945 [Leptospira interrogans str. UI 12621]QOI33244.1 hypothetical protein LeptoLang_02690 [Leptospira interrogans serovar Icterohaemorrhagiae]QOI33259.1 hypothetical protein LeptoLang_02785 [Leptospira interrogans serovar Icterohaemorrhagiae]QOI35556.1 hypothetical protein LeptoLang_15920 [Leptospira interrogans serovar Icterohaemorrhagiae]
MGLPLLVEKSDFLVSLRPLLGPVRTPKTSTSHPLRASLAPPLHGGCTSNENENGGHILKRNWDSWQNE